MEFIHPMTWDEWQKSLFQAFRTPEIGWDLIVNQMLYRTGFTQLDRSDSIRCGNGTVCTHLRISRS